MFAHGFTQTADSWSMIRHLLRERLADTDLDTIAVDMPGHGSASDISTDLQGAADLLVAAGGRGAYVGYSMGGRIALHAALRHPDDVDHLVLIGATAGIDDDADRRDRRIADELHAKRIEAIGVEAFIDEWLANPLFAGLDSESARRDQRLSNTSTGLADSLRRCGTGTQEPLWDRLGDIGCPTLILVGAEDPKFRTLAERLADGLPNAHLVVISDSGHSVHLEQPAAAVDAIARFLHAN